MFESAELPRFSSRRVSAQVSTFVEHRTAIEALRRLHLIHTRRGPREQGEPWRSSTTANADVPTFVRHYTPSDVMRVLPVSGMASVIFSVNAPFTPGTVNEAGLKLKFDLSDLN
jgi:hypothetical protein